MDQTPPPSKAAAPLSHSRSTALCDTEHQSSWPRYPRSPTLPDKLVVLLKPCPGFVLDKNDWAKHYSWCPAPLNMSSNNDMRGLGGLAGYSVEHVKETARLLGYTERDLVFRCTSSTPDLIHEVSKEMADIGLACVTVTEERMSAVEFSTPYYSTGYRILVKRGAGASEPLDWWGGLGARGLVVHSLLRMVTALFNEDIPRWTFFQPFEEEVWASIGIFVVVFGILIWRFEKSFNRNKYEALDAGGAEEEDHEGEDRNSLLGAKTTATSSQRHVVDTPQKRRPLSGRTSLGDHSSRGDNDAGPDSPPQFSPAKRTSNKLYKQTPNKDQDHHHPQYGAEPEQRPVERKNPTVLVSTFRAASFLLSGNSAGTKSLETPWAKALGIVASLAGVLVMTWYVANLAAYMTVRNLKGPIQSIDDLRGETVSVKCPLDRTKENFAQTYLRTKYPDIKVYCEYGNYFELALSVAGGRTKAAIYDAPLLEYLVANDPDYACGLEVVGDIFGPQEYAYAFPKSSLLREPFSEAITHSRGADGLHEKLHPRYFGLETSDCGVKGLSTDSVGLRSFGGIGVILVVCVGVIALHFAFFRDAGEDSAVLGFFQRVKEHVDRLRGKSGAKIPAAKVPDVPNVDIPTVKVVVPDLPDLGLPDVDLPKNVPAFPDIPDVHLPSMPHLPNMANMPKLPPIPDLSAVLDLNFITLPQYQLDFLRALKIKGFDFRCPGCNVDLCGGGGGGGAPSISAGAGGAPNAGGCIGAGVTGAGAQVPMTSGRAGEGGHQKSFVDVGQGTSTSGGGECQNDAGGRHPSSCMVADSEENGEAPTTGQQPAAAAARVEDSSAASRTADDTAGQGSSPAPASVPRRSWFGFGSTPSRD